MVDKNKLKKFESLLSDGQIKGEVYRMDYLEELMQLTGYNRLFIEMNDKDIYKIIESGTLEYRSDKKEKIKFNFSVVFHTYGGALGNFIRIDDISRG